MALALGAWLAILLLEASPHFVHHLFETDDHDRCGFAATADHAPAAIGATGLLHGAGPAPERAEPAATPFAATPSGRPVATRAPPSAPFALA